MSATKQQLTERPPVVAVLGHVDHGKSTLLDFIRKSNTVGKEAGGITQHVAAYEVTHKNKRITFIDTPGHAAFGAIRARGANVADIAILVVAADDGVKAQTLEALESIRAAEIPFIVAINKIDKPNADRDRTIRTLLEEKVYLEKYGGDVPWTAISAKEGTGVDELLDVVLLVAELQGLKADAAVPAKGYVLEAHRDQKRGIAASLIILDGSLKSGMAILAGNALAPVRIMEDHNGKSLREASFSTPITVVGFDELPQVGEEFTTYKNKKEAEAARAARAPQSTPLQRAPEESERYYLPVIIRADASGSLEAIAHELAKLGDEHAVVSIVLSGIGDISENDVKAALAGTNRALVIGFDVRVDPIAEALARERGAQIEVFDIIYKLTERVQEVLAESKPKREVIEVFGRARVLRQFGATKTEHVVGGKVLDGYLSKNSSVRVLRRDVLVGTGKIENIQANKQNVDRVEAGSEFGVQIKATFEIAGGDILESFASRQE